MTWNILSWVWILVGSNFGCVVGLLQCSTSNKDGWMDERCFRPLFCTVKAELGRGQPGLMRWIWDETLPQSSIDRSTFYSAAHCATKWASGCPSTWNKSIILLELLHFFSVLTVSTCIPVVIGSEFYGIALADMNLNDLFADAVEFYKSHSYAILIDKYGTVLSHPMLPKVSGTSDTAIGIKIEALDPRELVQEKVFTKMKGQETGNTTLYVKTVSSKGETSREGIVDEYRHMAYYYNKVSKLFLFRLCVWNVLIICVKLDWCLKYFANLECTICVLRFKRILVN